MKMFERKDLGLAYRKAKVDLYYSSNVSLDAIADYEENLHKNLSALRKKINGADESWVTKAEFFGDWTLATTSIDMEEWHEHKKENGNGLIFSSPADEWKHACDVLTKKNKSKRPKAEFRVMANCSLDFHVLSTLWILEVGHLFDASLSDCAYGNRLRRTQDDKKLNRLSLGSFQPYFKPFRDWRDKGIEVMQTALAANKKVVAVTADVTSFYHELNPSFMLEPTFHDMIGLKLNERQLKLNRLFIHALQAWAAATPLKKGLPVGLPASAIVANMALVALDRYVEHEVVPLYYGRYVDDILLVMENGRDFKSTVELWEWLFNRSDKTLDWVDSVKEEEIAFKPNYLKTDGTRSQIHFSNNKNKVFILEGDPGKSLVASISHQIQERASEWRAMPRLPRLAHHVGTDLLAATQNDGETADNLRKADALTMRRAGFAIKLRDFEAYERDLSPEAWADHRHAFFNAFIHHVLVLPQFFDLAAYLPRVIRLATTCEDFAELRRIIEAVCRLCKDVSQDCRIRIKACPDENMPDDVDIISRWEKSLFCSIRESIIAAFPPQLSKTGKQAWEQYMEVGFVS